MMTSCINRYLCLAAVVAYGGHAMDTQPLMGGDGKSTDAATEAKAANQLQNIQNQNAADPPTNLGELDRIRFGYEQQTYDSWETLTTSKKIWKVPEN